MDTALIAELERLGREVERDRLIASLELLGCDETPAENESELAKKKAAKRSRFSPEYIKYINSEHWQERRRRIKPKRCCGCNTTEHCQLHHRVYPKKGAPLQAFIDQPDSQFSWLCPTCHKHIGKALKEIRNKKYKGGSSKKK